MEITTRPFDNSDWELFPGCEGKPEIAYVTLPFDGTQMECAVVVDDNGINLDYYDTNGEPLVIHDFQMNMDGKGVAHAKEVLARFALDNPRVDAGVLQALGFIYNKV